MGVFRFWAFGYVLLLLAAVGVAVFEPISFQKTNIAVRAPQSFPDLIVGAPLDVEKIVGAIPYRGGEVWAVQPAAKFEAAILEGRGNCATKTLGLAYLLGQSAIDFQIIDLLHPRDFLNGGGHTLLRVAYQHDGQKRLGLVDMLEGGLPYDGKRYFDVADLVNGPIPNARVDPLNAHKDDHARYFGEFLEGVVIAFRSADEVNRYHGFLSSIYLPLGHEKLEKYIYDGIALLFGVLPSLHVTEYDRLFDNIGAKVALHQSALWILRSALIMLPLLLLMGWRLQRSGLENSRAARPLHRQLDQGAN